MDRLAWTMVIASALARAADPVPQAESTFHVGTRLVEVDVVVRDKNGPVTGLTKNDFTVFDCKPRPVGQDQLVTFGLNTSWCKGNRQAIQLFRAPGSGGTSPRSALPPGLVSNRVDSRGSDIGDVTVLLLDQLNVSFDHKDYERSQVIKYLKTLRGSDQIAVYSLGKDLHILQDFTDDPQKLVNAVSKLDSGLDALHVVEGDPSLSAAPTPAQTGDAEADAFIAKMDAGADEVNPSMAGMYDQITNEAVRKIVQHLYGAPGRRNLIWIKETPSVPGVALLRLRAANIALYPVLVRSLQGSGVLDMTAKKPAYVGPVEFVLQHAVRDLGASLGGAGFGDAADVAAAVSRAEEDSGSSYLLGFYPSESDLDGKLHTLNVTLSHKFAKAGLELVFRRQYLATAQSGISENETPSEVFENPLSATAIGLSAVATPGQTGSGVYQLDITVNLADIQLRPMGDRWVGSLRMEMRRDLPDASGVIKPAEPVVQIQPISLTEEELKTKETTGFVIRQRWTGLGMAGGSLRIVIQDQATGAAGSLRVPLGKVKE